MSNIRKNALNYLEKGLGAIPGGFIRTSRYYPSEKSWTKRPSWWHEIPLAKLQDSKCKEVHIVCEKLVSGFFYLRVPSSFLLENLTSLCIREGEMISLFLSAVPPDIFTDYRGGGKIQFSKWLVEL
jgi:hypothetical protein